MASVLSADLMRVIYDISYLSLAAMHASRAESGVGRVCRNILTGLAARTDCDLTLSSSEHVQGGLLYAGGVGMADRFHGPSSGAARLFGRCLAGMHPRLFNTGPDVPAGTARRLARRIWHRLAKVPVNPLNDSQLAGADIFHASHFPLPAFPPAGRHLRKVITICDVIPLLRPDFFDEGINAFFRRIAASIDRDTWVVAISESTKRDVCSVMNVLPERVFVAPLAAETSIFHPCDDAAEKAAVLRSLDIPEKPYLLSLCTLEPRKNLPAAVNAFCRMARQNPDIELNLVLVGARGWHPERLEESLKRAGDLRSRIFLPGYVPDGKLAALYGGAKAFIYLSEYEGFGLPPLEAMQCGVPVIASNTTSLPEVVGDAGILVNPRDEAAIVDALCRLCRDGAWQRELGMRGRRRASCFTWSRCTDNVIATYRAAMSG